MATLWWSDAESFLAELATADKARALVMQQWARERELSADRPGMQRKPKLRRMYHRMRVAADARVARP